MTGWLSTIASTTPSVARTIETTLNVIGQVELAETAKATGKAIAGAASFVENQLTDENSVLNQLNQFIPNWDTETFSGTTTTSEPAAADSRLSSAPTVQDLQAACNPQLTTAGDPTPSTDPAIPSGVEHSVPIASNSHFVESQDPWDWIVENYGPEAIEEIAVEDPMILDEINEAFKTTQLFVIVGGKYKQKTRSFLKEIKVAKNTAWKNRLLPQTQFVTAY